jgi:Ser/Thr protein kinase RdoA (MazF antagonist)
MHSKPDYKSIFEQFKTEGTFASCAPIGEGHINDTFLAKTAEPEFPEYVIQRINHAIFKDVDGLMENIRRITSHLQNKLNEATSGAGHTVAMRLIETIGQKTYFKDLAGNYWRCFEFVKNHTNHDAPLSLHRAFEGGKALGKFQLLLSDLPGEPLFEILPDFHNLKKRLDNFNQALTQNPVGRVDSVKTEIEKMLDRADEMLLVYRLGEAGKIPVRITHNDTKFNNILFDDKENAICIIDLDTVMPGFVLYDFGDAIRTLANTATEDEDDLLKVSFDLVLYKSFAQGYLTEAGKFLTPTEKEHLAFSAKLLTYIMGLRFLTDHIAGDVYYKISRPSHNLVRARNQIRLLECMEENFGEMQKAIAEMHAS